MSALRSNRPEIPSVFYSMQEASDQPTTETTEKALQPVLKANTNGFLRNPQCYIGLGVIIAFLDPFGKVHSPLFAKDKGFYDKIHLGIVFDKLSASVIFFWNFPFCWWNFELKVVCQVVRKDIWVHFIFNLRKVGCGRNIGHQGRILGNSQTARGHPFYQVLKDTSKHTF